MVVVNLMVDDLVVSSIIVENRSFLFNGKNYQFKRLPFGLNTSVASFIKCLDKSLQPHNLDFLTIYVDDILIASRTVSYTHLDVYKRQT